MRVAVIDVGTPGKNLGWAVDEPDEEAQTSTRALKC
jgi:hypothetical protein